MSAFTTVPEVQVQVSAEAFLKLLGHEYPDLGPVDHEIDMVTSLNRLSKTVGEQYGSK
jgi:hypothetical protein